MNIIRKISVFFLLQVVLTTSAACQQQTADRQFSTDQQAILELYASKYLSQENHQFYVKSEKRNTILNVLNPP